MDVAVIIPCYKVTQQILGVIEKIGAEVSTIIAVDDCCPDGSGDFIESNCSDERVVVLRNEVNKGVGGAVKTGYQHALKIGADIAVKVDGDGQMDPALLPRFIKPILNGDADYTKGNRFHSFYNVRTMPKVRLFGNAILSLMTKVSSGYYGNFDPTNGYTAIHCKMLNHLNFDNIDDRYFFESDMLINLGLIKAVTVDIPMEAVYADETSNLHIKKVIGTFFVKNIKESFKRVIYNYFLRDFNIASLQVLFGTLMTVAGTTFGAIEWVNSIATETPATSGSVMLAALPIILGVQLLGSFISYDVANQPKLPLQRIL